MLLVWLGAAMTGCRFDGDMYNYYTTGDGDTDLTADTDVPIVSPVVPTVAADELKFNIFDHDQTGTVMWLDVSSETVAAMNSDWQNGAFGGGGFFGGIYNVDETFSTTLSDHFFVQTLDGSATDYNQIEVSLAGQSTGATWEAQSIPNFNLDFDQVVDGLKLGGKHEHLRLNNAQVGSMFGEPTALATLAGLGYPVPKTNYVLVGGRTWGQADKLIPYIAVEKYKRSWCDDHADQLGGGCVNIWEGYGLDVTAEIVGQFANACELSSCDNMHLNAFAEVVSTNMGTPDFQEATAPFFDWTLYQQFQCNEWLLWIGDDALHNMNNIVLVEGVDGKFRYLPYSTDISAGLAWGGAYSQIPLYGMNAMSMGCQQDEACWAETIATCEGQIAKLAALHPESLVDAELNQLQHIKYPWGDDGGDGALRPPDTQFYTIARSFYVTRPEAALAELELYRAPQVPMDTGAKDTDPPVPPEQLAYFSPHLRPVLWAGLNPKSLPLAYPIQ